MKLRVMQAKVLLYIAIRRQEERGLATDILEEQLAFGFPGLGQEVTEICQELGLPDASRLDVDPNELKEAIKVQNLKKSEFFYFCVPV